MAAWPTAPAPPAINTDSPAYRARFFQSAGLIPENATRTRTSPASGSGTGRCRSRKPADLSYATAFISGVLGIFHSPGRRTGHDLTVSLGVRIIYTFFWT